MVWYSYLFKCFSQLLKRWDTSTTEHRLHLGPATSFFPGLLVVLLHSSPVACWTPSDPGDSSFGVISFCPFIHSSWGSHSKYTGVVCHSLHQWITFCRNSPLWPICLGWPYMAWLIASLSYASPFTMTRQWSVEGKIQYIHTIKYYSTIKRNEAIMHTTTCMNLKNILMSKRSQSHKSIYWMISLIWKVQKIKSIETKIKLVVTLGASRLVRDGKRIWEVTAKRYEVSFWCNEMF